MQTWFCLPDELNLSAFLRAKPDSRFAVVCHVHIDVGRIRFVGVIFF